MSDRDQYSPGPARGAEVRKDGEKWTLVLVRELRHAPAKVWEAITDPAHLREWAPFDEESIPVLALLDREPNELLLSPDGSMLATGEWETLRMFSQAKRR